MNTGLKTTPLNEWHRSANANMAGFGGYEMPLWYPAGIKTEHLRVLLSAGLFDTSHMSCISVEGTDAFSLLNHCFTRDLTGLSPLRCVYGAFLNTDGHCIDDAIIYKFYDTRYMICVNAGMGSLISNHLLSNKADASVKIIDLTGKIAKIDIQGPQSANILARLLQHPESVFDSMPYFSFKGQISDDFSSAIPVDLKDNTKILLSRSGYTGEFGFEVFLSCEKVVDLWCSLLDAGREFDLISCGLGARDSLRTGACLPLSHQDIGSWKFIHHPWEFALPFSKDKSGFTKKFTGDAALMDETVSAYTYPFIGESVRKVAAGGSTQVIDQKGRSIGTVLTCTTDMGITRHNQDIISIASPDKPEGLEIKGLSCGFVKVTEKLDPETALTLRQGKREIQVRVCTDIRPDRTARKKISHFFKPL